MKLRSLLVKGCFLLSFIRAQLHDAAKSAVRHHITLRNLCADFFRACNIMAPKQRASPSQISHTKLC